MNSKQNNIISNLNLVIKKQLRIDPTRMHSIETIRTRCQQILQREASKSISDNSAQEKSLTYSSGTYLGCEQNRSQSGQSHSNTFHEQSSISFVDRNKEAFTVSHCDSESKNTQRKISRQQQLSIDSCMEEVSYIEERSRDLTITQKTSDDLKQRFSRIKNSYENNTKILIKCKALTSSTYSASESEKINEAPSSKHQSRIRSKEVEMRENDSNQSSSFNRDLKGMNKPELVDLLLQEIEQNQRNKHLLDQRTREFESLQAELHEQRSVLAQKQLQISVLIDAQRRNLQTIDQLQTKSNLHKTVSHDITFQNESKAQAHQNDKYFEEIQKYMEEYISNTKQAQSEYKRNLNSLREVNSNLKGQCKVLRAELQRLQAQNSEGQAAFGQLRADMSRLQLALENGRHVMKELQHQFLSVKQEDQKLKVLNQKQAVQIQQFTQKTDILSSQLGEISQRYLDFTREVEGVLEAAIADFQIDLQRLQSQEPLKSLYSHIKKLFLDLQDQNKEHCRTIQALEHQKRSNQTESQRRLSQTVNTHENTNENLKLQLHKALQKITYFKKDNQELNRLQTKLLQEYQSERQQKHRLIQELKQISIKVYYLESTYKKQMITNSKIKAELQKFWQMTPHQSSLNNPDSISHAQISDKSAQREKNYHKPSQSHKASKQSREGYGIEESESLQELQKEIAVSQSKKQMLQSLKAEPNFQSECESPSGTYSFNQESGAGQKWDKVLGQRYPLNDMMPLVESPINCHQGTSNLPLDKSQTFNALLPDHTVKGFPKEKRYLKKPAKDHIGNKQNRR